MRKLAKLNCNGSRFLLRKNSFSFDIIIHNLYSLIDSYDYAINVSDQTNCQMNWRRCRFVQKVQSIKGMVKKSPLKCCIGSFVNS